MVKLTVSPTDAVEVYAGDKLLYTWNPLATDEPVGAILTDLKVAFMAAVKGGHRDAAFAALGVPKCSDVAVTDCAAILAKLESLCTK